MIILFNINSLKINSYDIFNGKAYEECLNLYSLCQSTCKCSLPMFDSEELCFVTDHPFMYTATYEDMLVGFAFVCMIDEDEMEICVYVHPDFRGNSIGSRLVDVIAYEYEDTYLVANINPENDISEFFIKNDFEYESTECKMSLSQETWSGKKIHSHLKKMLNLGSKIEYIDALDLDISINKEEIEASLKINKKALGSCQAVSFGDTAVIHDVFIEPAYRGNGYSKYMLIELLNKLFVSHNKVLLHVTKDNISAYSLYLTLGFTVDEQILVYVL